MDLLTIGEVAERSGFATSALRYYEREGLVHAERTAGGQRRFSRSVLRRLAFIRAAQNIGLSLEEVRSALATLPDGRTPTRADWSRLSRAWKSRLDERIAGLEALRDGLTDCIGCGCLSLRACRLYNTGDVAAAEGPGARHLPSWVRDGLGASTARPDTPDGRTARQAVPRVPSTRVSADRPDGPR